jgi:hypothetical protein
MSAAVQPIQGTRRLPSWIEGWMDYTTDLTSPPIFRRWSAIAAVSSVMERKLWITSQGESLFANLYVILCAPPGVGKSTVLSRVERMLGELPDLHLSPSSVTSAALVDIIVNAKRSVMQRGFTPIEFNYVAAIASELGVFLPQYEPAIMNTLTKMYDGEFYREARRGKDLRIEIPKPLLALFAGCTPAYLSGTMPEAAWDQGFLSRTIIVYSGEVIVTDPFAVFSQGTAIEGLRKDLLHDLKQIHSMVGEIQLTQEAAQAITAWHLGGNKPKPHHMKLQHYNTRRLVHLIKLCMVSCVARSADMLITEEDYQIAMNWLLEAEQFMPDIFKNLGLGGDSRAIEETWYFIYEAYAKEAKPIMEHRIISFLKERVPAHSIMRVLDIMVKSGMLEMVGPSQYKPAPKQTHH